MHWWIYVLLFFFIGLGEVRIETKRLGNLRRYYNNWFSDEYVFKRKYLHYMLYAMLGIRCFHNLILMENFVSWQLWNNIKFSQLLHHTPIIHLNPNLQEYLEESVQATPSNHDTLGDSVAWGGCTIIYLLGQQLHFELFDFSYQVLNVAEAEASAITQSHRNPQFAKVIILILMTKTSFWKLLLL